MDEGLIEKISQYYIQILKREPDKEGLEHYKKEIQEGRIMLEDLITIFKESEEYKTKFPKDKNSKKLSVESVFTEIYQKNLWGSTSSRSGPGSDLPNTENLRKELPMFLKKLEISSLLDIPCGDFFWMKEVNLDFLKYIGADVVEELIEENKKKYAKENRIFLKLNIISDELPMVDLIFCKDLFQHLSFKDIFSLIKNIKESKSKYLMVRPNILVNNNQDIQTGGVRNFNLFLPPFSFPKPLMVLDEYTLLWRIKDI